MVSGKWRPFCLGLNVLTYGDPFPCSYSLFSSVNIHLCGKKNLTFSEQMVIIPMI